ncbi:glycosyltransferase [Candidatus Nomurabacteria bacterium]|uniref:Glycosyltransferase n=1 Tax=candidate division WWE3 bacterium TaxID=2053526 RepID=A0A955E0G2_UNCKA|nr:glycosyltransferase [candidate division WWE3 bacterium]MCB9824133.1 glycosyltransferase [Candidatus Nomurabacteria bacterium]MCB9826896.1 glycosyltransferase [Candidatus Nomurabacteria bacterium]MCB9828074.1 glycosyltransferase [Candidatus Nomurabacteria bacterium]HXK52630.1 glycosyltransferase [bacterium]
MKILYTLDSANIGGMEKYVLDLAEGMMSRGHEVHIWCRQGPLAKIYQNAGAVVVPVEVKYDIDPLYIYRQIKYIKKHNIQVVHCNELRAVANTLIASRLAGVRCRISHIHTPYSQWQVPVYKRKIYSICYAMAVRLLSSSEIALTNETLKVKLEEGIPLSKLKIIGNSVNFDALKLNESQKNKYRAEILKKHGLPEDIFIIGNISRLTEEKGHRFLVSAFANLLESHPELSKSHLLVAGGGYLQESLEQQAKDLGISNKVTFTGRFIEEDKIKYLASFDMFIFPTLAEGFGIVLIEAMYMYIPLICSDLPVLKEVSKGTVKYFESGNSEDLCVKMYELFHSLDGLNTKERVVAAHTVVRKNYSLEDFVSSYEDLYKKCVRKKESE